MVQILFKKEQTGINMSFVLNIPDNINNDSTLILNGTTPGIGTRKQLDEDIKNNTNLYGTYSDSYEEAEYIATNMYFSPLYKKLANDYNNPMLIPIIPRCRALYTGYLGYDVYHENYDKAIEAYHKGNSGFNESELHLFDGLDKQIVAMIHYAIDYINETYSLNLDYKVIATGYSASSKMVNFFAALHPDLIKMIIAGGTGGLLIYPTLKYDYPLGFKDLPKRNLETFKQIPQFYYIGESDQLDPARPSFIVAVDENGNNLKDERGNVIPARENGKIKFIKDENGNYIISKGGYYSLEQTHIIYDQISSDVQERFDKNRMSYENEGVNSTFKKYHGNHDIDDENLEKDVIDFYEKYTSLNKQKNK